MANRGPTIAQASLALIRERGPLTIAELAPLLVAQGRTRAKDPEAAVRAAIDLDRSRLLEGRGGRWFSLEDQLEGAIFSVRPTAFERENEILLGRDELSLAQRLLHRDRWAHPDDRVHLDFFGRYFGLPRWDVDVVDVDEDGQLVLDPRVNLLDEIGEETAATLLAFLDEIGLPGGEDDVTNLRDLIEEYAWESVFHGPPGWLPALGSRDVAALRVEGGEVQAARYDRRALTGIHVEAAIHRVGDLIDDLLDLLERGRSEAIVPLEAVLALIVTEMPEILRRPLPPIPELVAMAGFDMELGFIARQAVDTTIRVH